MIRVWWAKRVMRRHLSRHVLPGRPPTPAQVAWARGVLTEHWGW